MPTINPWDWRKSRDNTITHGINKLGLINQADDYNVQPKPEFDYLSQAEEYALQADKMRRQRLDQIMKNSLSKAQQPSGPFQNIPQNQQNQQNPNVPNATGDFRSFINAISGQESGGSYNAVNPDSGAMGKYQIMPANIEGDSGWDMEALGRNVTTQQFVSSPQIQEAIARYKLNQYYQKYGAAGAASAWYSGDPDKWNNTSPQGNYPSIRQYVLDILQRMNG